MCIVSDTTEEAKEAPKAEKDIDQSSRAQEIAVTLADPPSPQTAATGTLNLITTTPSDFLIYLS